MAGEGEVKAASALRTEHQLSAHDDHHVRIADEPSYNTSQRAKPKPPVIT